MAALVGGTGSDRGEATPDEIVSYIIYESEIISKAINESCDREKASKPSATLRRKIFSFLKAPTR
jgi:hypothetical protein